MPLTVPIPDARWRATVYDRYSKGRDWPEVRHAATFRERARAVRLRFAVIVAALSFFSGMSAAGWLTAVVVFVTAALFWGWSLWFVYRFGELLVRAGYVRARARRAFTPAPRARRRQAVTS